MTIPGWSILSLCKPCTALGFFFLLLSSTLSCNETKKDREVNRSFYYWKTSFDFSANHKQKLDSLGVQTLYIKFFDVDWDDEKKQPKPIAKLQVENNKLAHDFEIIPTIFITNSCMQKIDAAQLRGFAANIQKLLFEMIASHSFGTIREIQFDCDWTATSRANYFNLLNYFSALRPTLTLSATIRLHQVKFVNRSGIPPVARGLLMCYNMGNLKDPATKNSILETAELKKYIAGISNYPLPLDVALPVFNWKVLFRQNNYAGLIQHLPGEVFSNSFAKKNGNRWHLLSDTVLSGYQFLKGDMIRDEQSDFEEILLAAKLVNSELKNNVLRVSLYHLDSVLLSKYTTHELEKIYNSMR